VHPQQVLDALTERTGLVSVIMASNEVGTINPIAEIGSICRSAGVLLHTDAAQAAGQLEIDVRALNVDMMSLSAHKVYGPKGVGALFLRRDIPRPEAILHGGGQEDSIRSGTLNVPGIVGFGMACRLARSRMPQDARRMAHLRDAFQAGRSDTERPPHPAAARKPPSVVCGRRR
ncbi:MAG: cysteine desulfurase family protein, partial [Acidobacteriota bacterium]